MKFLLENVPKSLKVLQNPFEVDNKESMIWEYFKPDMIVHTCNPEIRNKIESCHFTYKNSLHIYPKNYPYENEYEKMLCGARIYDHRFHRRHYDKIAKICNLPLKKRGRPYIPTAKQAASRLKFKKLVAERKIMAKIV